MVRKRINHAKEKASARFAKDRAIAGHTNCCVATPIPIHCCHTHTPDGVLVHQLIELAGDGPEVEVSQLLALAVPPDLLQGRHDGGDVSACENHMHAAVEAAGKHVNGSTYNQRT
jgi:hypothetical protein